MAVDSGKGFSTEQQNLNPHGAEEGKGGGYGTMEPKPPSRPSSLPLLNGHSVESGAEVDAEFCPDVKDSENQETSFNQQDPTAVIEEKGAPEGDETAAVPGVTLRQYLLSIVYMPKSLRILCLTNLFCWSSLVCYSLYFTDFVGEAVFGGDPLAPDGTPKKDLYEEGVRFGCWGMALYSLSCSVYSFVIEKLVKKFGARPVYVCGQLVYSVGMIFMASLRHKAAVIIFSCCAGVMYSTLFTMPYLLVAHYHASGMFKSELSEGRAVLADGPESQVRGLGTDVAIVSSMVFLAQFILSSCMGSIIAAVGSTTAVVCAASILAAFGALTATQVVYLDL
ncbi:hypothetical protein SK128_024266 [Halocaridina rubra]|uniref:Uncharacterized protein n=1 Tax=Halocaridina rubra TaxID=373956 RepID=A0AAN8XLI6_HALRR